MKLSMQIIGQALPGGNVHLACTRRGYPDEMRLNAMMLWEKSEMFETDVCYVLDGRQLKEDFNCPVGIALLVVGSVDPSRFASANADVLIWEPDSKMSGFRICFNYISRIFRQYQQLEQRLNNLLIKNADLQELVTLGEQLLGNPILLLDRNFCILNRIHKDMPLDYVTGPGSPLPTLTTETVNVIKINSGYSRDQLHEDVFYISSEYLNCGAMFLNVNRDQVVFLAAVLETSQPLTQAHRQLLSYFVEFIHTLLRHRSFPTAHTLHFEGFLRKMLSNEQIEQAVLDPQLLAMGWKNEDNYVCFTFEMDLWGQKNIVSHNLCQMVERTFPQSFAFFYEDKVVSIINLDHAGISRQALLNLMPVFVREQLFRVGISYTFFDFITFATYYQQTLAALEMGHKYKPDEWCYRFEDYVLPYFMHYGTTRIHGRHLCHPDLVQLWQYDYANNTELLPTLEMYLMCAQNATATASKLFIHRNTFYQRLTKIQQLITSNLDDPDNRLFMLMSYSFVRLLNLQPLEELEKERDSGQGKQS